MVGGGVVEAGDLLLGPTRRSFTDALAQRSRLPVAEVRPAELGNTAGVDRRRRPGPPEPERAATPETSAACVPLRVVSYNVHSQRDDTAALAAVVRAAAPDVVIVQEAPRRFRWRQKCATLAESFGLVVAAGGLPALGNLLLTSLRVRVRDTRCQRYPLTPGRHLRGAAYADCQVGAAPVPAGRLAPVHRPGRAAGPGGGVQAGAGRRRRCRWSPAPT